MPSSSLGEPFLLGTSGSYLNTTGHGATAPVREGRAYYPYVKEDESREDFLPGILHTTSGGFILSKPGRGHLSAK